MKVHSFKTAYVVWDRANLPKQLASQDMGYSSVVNFVDNLPPIQQRPYKQHTTKNKSGAFITKDKFNDLTPYYIHFVVFSCLFKSVLSFCFKRHYRPSARGHGSYCALGLQARGRTDGERSARTGQQMSTVSRWNNISQQLLYEKHEIHFFCWD